VNLIAYLFIILAVIWLVLRFRSRASRPVPRVSILAVVCTMFRLVSA
jgi:flagellar biogenesis protein FliO